MKHEHRSGGRAVALSALLGEPTADAVAAMAKEVKHALALGKTVEDGVRLGYAPMLHAMRPQPKQREPVKISKHDPSCMGAFLRARP